MSKNTYLSEVDKALLKLAKKQQVEDHPNKMRFSDADVDSGLIQKYAFDVYKVDNDPYESLWIRQDFEDGPYLVRASDPQYSKEEKGDWTAVSDYNRENITLAYKDIPIARFSSDEFGFDPKDVMSFKAALLESVEADGSFVKNILSGQPSGKREALMQTFPEFKKFI